MITSQIARQFKEVHFGGNWTSVNLKDTLADVDWKQAVRKTEGMNTIVALVYHMHYYVHAVLQVLQGGTLNAKDSYSFDHPSVQSPSDWDALLDTVWREAEQFALLVEQMTDEKLSETFSDPKYGTYYRNLTGVIEHMHYHLGQVVMMKKMNNE